MFDREQVIEMAKNAAILSDDFGHPDDPTWGQLERFAAIAFAAGAAAEREKVLEQLLHLRVLSRDGEFFKILSAGGTK
jgi:hypothetical protein